MILSLAIIGSPGNLIPGLFDDEPLDAGDLIVRFGWWGDANTDGQVDIGPEKGWSRKGVTTA